MVRIRQLQSREQYRRAYGRGGRGSDREHDHNLVLCGHHRAASPEDLASEHARN